ncbi:MAG: MBL fold metallo-hydrolase [Candidatus Omnitrophica bacterium]|nr:MBL fold metallo-hydrolase [Candidatus Omnitrophota bacterium]MDD5660990.1 MBL fold metallo-hydrolase [Candidatus Omnitrophota bacterium]
MIFETINVGPMQVNCYILACSSGNSAIIIDPGDQAGKIAGVLERHKLKPEMVINTHGHYDHIGCDDEFGVDVYVHKQDLAMLVDARKNLSAIYSAAYQVSSGIKILEDKQVIKLDCLELEVMHLPGHTLGGIGLLMKKPYTDIVFTGDTLFYRGIGRYDLPGGSRDSLEKAIKERLFVLPDNTKVYPGHGPQTTIGKEKQTDFF